MLPRLGCGCGLWVTETDGGGSVGSVRSPPSKVPFGAIHVPQCFGSVLS